MGRRQKGSPHSSFPNMKAAFAEALKRDQEFRELFSQPPAPHPGIAIIDRAQQVLARHLPPDGITEAQAISELLAILDSPDANALTLHLREPADTRQALRDAETLARSLCELIEGAGASDELTACSIRASQLLAHLQQAQSS